MWTCSFSPDSQLGYHCPVEVVNPFSTWVALLALPDWITWWPRQNMTWWQTLWYVHMLIGLSNRDEHPAHTSLWNMASFTFTCCITEYLRMSADHWSDTLWVCSFVPSFNVVLCCAMQHGRMRSSLQPHSNHGERNIQVHWQHSAFEEPVNSLHTADPYWP